MVTRKSEKRRVLIYLKKWAQRVKILILHVNGHQSVFTM